MYSPTMKALRTAALLCFFCLSLPSALGAGAKKLTKTKKKKQAAPKKGGKPGGPAGMACDVDDLGHWRSSAVDSWEWDWSALPRCRTVDLSMWKSGIGAVAAQPEGQREAAWASRELRGGSDGLRGFLQALAVVTRKACADAAAAAPAADGTAAIAGKKDDRVVLRVLDLLGHRLGPDGGKALAAALSGGGGGEGGKGGGCRPALVNAFLGNTGVGDAGASALAAVLLPPPPAAARRGGGGASAAAAAPAPPAPLRVLRLADCAIGDEGAKALALGLSRDAGLWTLDLRENLITNQGATALAAAAAGRPGPPVHGAAQAFKAVAAADEEEESRAVDDWAVKAKARASLRQKEAQRLKKKKGKGGKKARAEAAARADAEEEAARAAEKSAAKARAKARRKRRSEAQGGGPSLLRRLELDGNLAVSEAWEAALAAVLAVRGAGRALEAREGGGVARLKAVRLGGARIGDDGAAALALALRMAASATAAAQSAVAAAAEVERARLEAEARHRASLKKVPPAPSPSGDDDDDDDDAFAIFSRDPAKRAAAVTAAAAAAGGCGGIETIDLRDNGIGPVGAAAIARALPRCAPRLGALYLEENPLGDDGFAALAKALEQCVAPDSKAKKNKQQQEQDGQTPGKGTAAEEEEEEENAAVANAGGRGLRLLSLSHSGVGVDGVRHLGMALWRDSSITELVLDGNDVGEGGAKALASALKRGAPLARLDLRNAQLGDGGAKAIAQALRRDGVGSDTLARLSLDNNGIGPAGAAALGAALGELAAPSALSDLLLNYNPGIGAVGAAALAAGLSDSNHKRLGTLELRDCGLGSEGAEALAGAFRAPTAAELNDQSGKPAAVNEEGESEEGVKVNPYVPPATRVPGNVYVKILGIENTEAALGKAGLKALKDAGFTFSVDEKQPANADVLWFRKTALEATGSTPAKEWL